MSSKALKTSARSLYQEDFAAWATETARLLRAGRLAEVDVEHVAEEIEDMGKSEKRELMSRLTVLLVHLLKWNGQPKKRSSGWQATIATQRTELRRLFRQSPSLMGTLEAAIEEVYQDAAEGAVIETGLGTEVFPQRCPFSTDQVLDRTFLPE